MAQIQQHLVQQVNALRKENSIYRVEFRELKQEIKNYKQLLENSNRTNKLFRTQIQDLQREKERLAKLIDINNRLREEIKELRAEYINLRRVKIIESRAPFEDLSAHDRKAIRKRLDGYFTGVLEVNMLLRRNDSVFRPKRKPVALLSRKNRYVKNKLRLGGVVGELNYFSCNRFGVIQCMSHPINSISVGITRAIIVR